MPQNEPDFLEERGGKLLPLTLWVVPSLQSLPLAVECLDYLLAYLKGHDYDVATIPTNWRLPGEYSRETLLDGLADAPEHVQDLQQLLLYNSYINYHQVQGRIVLGVGGWLSLLYAYARGIEGGLEYLISLMSTQPMKEPLAGDTTWLRLLFEYVVLHTLVTPTYYYFLPGDTEFESDFQGFLDKFQEMCKSRGCAMLHVCQFPAPEEAYWDVLGHWPRVAEDFNYDRYRVKEG